MHVRCLIPLQASSSLEPVASFQDFQKKVPSSDKGKQENEPVDVAMEDIKEELDDMYGDDVADGSLDDDEEEDV